jgi:two-component system cell cycle sensor histidine kinase/response regulator CckA
MKPMRDPNLPEPMGQALTVLLVEDNEQLRKWLHGALEKLGYNLLEACDGADALLIAELHPGPIDVVVTDVMMPRVNGVELLRELMPIRPHIRALYISGYPEPLLRESTMLPPDVNYLAKPFEIRDLVARIESLALR